jgi:hypothetical protein
VSSLGALVGVIVWRAVNGLPSGAISAGVAVLGSLVLVVAAGVVGKLAGIAVGRQRHRILSRRLARRVRSLGAEL